jgi:hypothetical protein
MHCPVIRPGGVEKPLIARRQVVTRRGLTIYRQLVVGFRAEVLRLRRIGPLPPRIPLHQFRATEFR